MIIEQLTVEIIPIKDGPSLDPNYLKIRVGTHASGMRFYYEDYVKPSSFVSEFDVMLERAAKEIKKMIREYKGKEKDSP